MTVLSVQKRTVTLAAGAASATSTELTGITSLAHCVPFVTARITATSSQNDDEFQDYLVRAELISGPNRVQITTGPATPNATRAMVLEVTVVEFDSTLINVYSGTSSMAGFDSDVTTAIGATVDPTKAWLYFTHTNQNGIDWYTLHTVRGRITDNVGTTAGTIDSVTFDTQSGQDPALVVQWYVVECQNTEWSVQSADIVLLDATDTVITDTITSVAANKTFVLGSHRCSAGTDQDGPHQHLIDVKLSNATTVTATRQTASGQIDWHGFVVTFSGNENVYRGTLNWLTTELSKTDIPIGATVTEADSMVHLAGQTGNFGGGHWKRTTGSSNRVPDAFTAWTFTSGTQLTVTHSNNDDTGGENDQDLSWEVIEWDVGGAPPVTPRRVMVIT